MIEIKVPIALLLDRKLTSRTKLVWMLFRLHGNAPPPLVSRIVAQSGIAPTTVREAITKLAALTVPPGPVATVPGPLLTDPKVTPAAKVLYGILQSQAESAFTYPELSRHSGLGANTLKRAVAALTQAGWLETAQPNRLAPTSFSLRNPILNRQQLEVEQAKLRLKLDPNRGEALMKEFLSLLVDSTEFEDNARPGFLINPTTGQRMELDRYYINVAAFEYNGSSHEGTTDEALEQQARDMMKVGICALRQIPVVVVRSEDLTLEGMRAKVGQLLPLRNLSGNEPLIAFLERRARRYREGGGP